MILKTIIQPSQEIEQRERPGFVDVCCYGSLKPEPNELGSIVRYLDHDVVETLERIFISHDETPQWINTADFLPPERKYVLVRHNGNWFDKDDQENVRLAVAKLVKGISEEDRENMKNGLTPLEHQTCFDGDYRAKTYERWKIYKGEDQHANNLVPYKWETFGPTSFFGQDVTMWKFID